MFSQKVFKSKVLIVDDNPANLSVLFEMLNAHGCDVFVANSGEKALQIAEKKNIDVILLDIMMPEMNGFEVCKRLKENKKTRDITVIFLSALSETNDIIKGFEIGAMDYITKPFQSREIIARLKNHIEIKKLTKTLQKEVEERKEIEKQLRKAHQTKNRFLTNMSHELKTPLNAINGMTALLKNSKLDNQQYEYAEQIKSSSQVLLLLINNLIDFSKIDSGEFKLNCVEFSIRKLIDEVYESFTEKAKEKSLDLFYNISKEIPHVLKGDPYRLKQIFSNLINNAIKFTEKGNVSIKLALEKIDKTYAVINCSVFDTGIGIQKEQFHTLFESFSQADESATRKYAGTGLGLAICKLLLDLMGGEIGVESNEGQGSNFWFNVKLRRVHKKDQDSKKKDSREQEFKSTDKKQKPCSNKSDESARSDFILLVEDNITNQMVAKGVLKIHGFKTKAVNNGQKAIELLEKEKYCLILMDIQMPVMNGIKATKIIRDPDSKVLDHDVPIIAMTANSSQEDRSIYIDAGMNDLIGKPFNEKLFIKTVSRYILPKKAKKEQTENKQTPIILVVDDNTTNHKLMANILNMNKFKSEICNNGKQALDKLAEKEYDLVLMDLQMPVMNGITATKIIRNSESETKNPKIPIIAMTASAMEDDRQRCFDAGMNDFVSKPILEKELIKIINKHIFQKEDPVNIPHIDYNSLLKRMLGDEELCQNIILSAINDLNKIISQCKNLLKENNFTKLWDVNELIIMTASTIEAKVLEKAASEFGNEILNKDEEGINNSFKKLEKIFNELKLEYLKE